LNPRDDQQFLPEVPPQHRPPYCEGPWDLRYLFVLEPDR